MTSKQNQRDAKALESLFVKFGKAIFTQLRLEGTASIPVDLYMKISFEENGTSSLLPAFRYDYWSFLLIPRIFRFFLGSEETELCARALWETGILHFPPEFLIQDDEENTIENPSFDEMKVEIIKELLVSIEDFCECYNTFRPSRKQLIEQYHRFKELWTAPHIRYDVTFPLVNFDSDIQQESAIDSHLQLAPFSPQEKTIMWNEHTFRFPMRVIPISSQDFSYVKFRLTGLRYQKKGSEVDHPFFHVQETIAEMGNVLTALRLLKEGDVGAPVIFEKGHISSWTGMAYYAMPLKEYLIRDQNPDFPLTRYMLRESDLLSANSIFKNLERLNSQQAGNGIRQPHGDLTVALRRFNQAYGRDIPEDRIIDLTIALESCLLTEHEELTYRLSLRGAALLSQDMSWEPNKAYSLLKALYAVRSAIVHAGQQLSDLGKELRKLLQKLEIQPNELPQHCENIVRDILKAYVMRLANGSSVQTVINDLDRHIVGSLASQSDTA